MRLKALSTAIAVGAGSVSAALLGAAGSAQAVEPATVPLAISHYSHMLVDSSHQHLFFSQGAGTDGILVTDLSGGKASTITGEQGATALALSPDGSTLYVALSDGNAIAAIDTTTLTEKSRYATGTGSAPTSLAVSGGKVWYSYTTADGTGGIGVIDPNAAAPAATPQPAMSTWANAPVLASASDELVAEDFAGQHMATFGQTSGTPVLQADGTVASGATPGSLRVSPDGTQVLSVSPGLAGIQVFSTADLSHTSIYGADTMDSLAVAADGTLAEGTAVSDGTDLATTVGAGGGPYLNSVDLHDDGTTDRLAVDGLAWMPDNIGVYAVTNTTGGGFGLHAVPDARVTKIDLYLDASYGITGQEFTLQGDAFSVVPLPVGATLQVSRDGTSLPDATVTDSRGDFTVSDNLSTSGDYSYTVSYAGDATHAAASYTLAHVSVEPYQVASGARTVTAVPDQVDIAGELYAEDQGAPIFTMVPMPADAVVNVSRTDQNTGQTVKLPPLTLTPMTDPTNEYSFKILDDPGTTDTYVYHLSYAGALSYSADNEDITVQVAKFAPVVTYSGVKFPVVDARNGQITIKGALTQGPFPAGETLQVKRIDPADPSGVSLGTVPLATDGTFSFTDAPHYGGNNAYTLTYAGDALHSSAISSVPVTVGYSQPYLKVQTNASTYGYGSTATVTATLGSTFTNRTVTLYAQPYRGTRTAITTGKVNSHGVLSTSYRVLKQTVFTAAFAGDYEYAPATASTSVHVQASLAERQSGYYGTTRYGTTTYAVYHHTAKAAVSSTVYPLSKAGECATFQLQEYWFGGWHTISKSGCYTLNSGSTAARSYTLTSSTIGHLYRWQAAYFHSSADQANLDTAGSWLYFTVRN